MSNQPTCEERVKGELEGRIEDLSKLWEAYQKGDEEVEDLGTFNEYGLCFDYVSQDTFKDQDEAYFRYQLSYGGPQDEFRFFVNPDLSLHRVEYWFLDWFDGAHIVLNGEKKELLSEIWDFFVEIGSAQAELEKAKD